MAVLPPPTTTTSPLQMRLLAEVHLLQEQGRRDDAGGRVAGHAEAAAAGRARREEDRVEALALEIGELEVATHRGVQPELNAESEDAVDVLAQGRPGQAVVGDADRHHAARDGHRLEDRHAVAEAGQVVGRGHAGRPAADDRDAFGPTDLRRLDRRQVPMLGREPLQGPDGDRLVEDAAAADRLARRRADEAADRGERVDLRRDGIRVVPAAVREQSHVAAGIGSGRAGGLARGDRLDDAVRAHRSPDLPGLRALPRRPGFEGIERRDLRRLERLPSRGRERDPAHHVALRPADGTLARRERCRVLHAREGHDDDRALTDADAAADALADLDRVLHHPGEGPAAPAGLDAGPVRRVMSSASTGQTSMQMPQLMQFAAVDVDAVAHDGLRATARAWAAASDAPHATGCGRTYPIEQVGGGRMAHALARTQRPRQPEARPPSAGRRPFATARAASSVRLDAWSFSRMLRRWNFAVFSVIPRRPRSPCSAVRPSPGPGPPARGRSAGRGPSSRRRGQAATSVRGSGR